MHIRQSDYGWLRSGLCVSWLGAVVGLGREFWIDCQFELRHSVLSIDCTWHLLRHCPRTRDGLFAKHLLAQLQAIGRVWYNVSLCFPLVFPALDQNDTKVLTTASDQLVQAGDHHAIWHWRVFENNRMVVTKERLPTCRHLLHPRPNVTLDLSRLYVRSEFTNLIQHAQFFSALLENQRTRCLPHGHQWQLSKRYHGSCHEWWSLVTVTFFPHHEGRQDQKECTHTKRSTVL